MPKDKDFCSCGNGPPSALIIEKTQQKCPLGCPHDGYNMMKSLVGSPGCPSSGENVLKCLLGCPSSGQTWWSALYGGQNAVTCPTTFSTLVPHRIQEVPFLLFSHLPLKHPEPPTYSSFSKLTHSVLVPPLSKHWQNISPPSKPGKTAEKKNI